MRHALTEASISCEEIGSEGEFMRGKPACRFFSRIMGMGMKQFPKEVRMNDFLFSRGGKGTQSA